MNGFFGTTMLCPRTQLEVMAKPLFKPHKYSYEVSETPTADQCSKFDKVILRIFLLLGTVMIVFTQ